jgi:uncharacterized protein
VAGEPWTAAADGVVIDVRLTPRGGRDAIEGTERRADGRAVLKVRVRAVPAAGEANAALCLTIAKALAIAPRQVTLAGGATSRLKRIRVAGEAAVLIAALRRLVSDRGDRQRTTDRNAHIPFSVLRARSSASAIPAEGDLVEHARAEFFR